MKVTGGCFCGELRYDIELDSPEDARTSLCHCRNCKKFTGGAYGITTKIPVSALKISTGTTKIHIWDQGGSKLFREFCGTCGSGILEYGEAAKDNFRYIFYGSLDEPEKFPPKGEFFVKLRDSWLSAVSGAFRAP